MRRTLPFLLLLLVFWGCQPDKPQPTNSQDPIQLLTSGNSRTWRLQTLAIAGNPEPLPPCRSDDRWTFQSNGSTTLQNPTTCSPDEPSPTISGSFRFTNNNRFLVLYLGNLTETREIIQLSNNLLVWSFVGPDGKIHEETWVP